MSDFIPFLLENCRDSIYAEATQILYNEINGWEGSTYEEITQHSSHPTGFANAYLILSANFEEFTSSAKIPIMLKLAELDLLKGTTTEELVYSCCHFLPKKEALQKLIELGSRNESEHAVARSVLEFQRHQDYTCLIILFSMATRYRKETRKYPTDQMMREIEECCLYLIELGQSFDLDLENILNKTTKSGNTLFDQAAAFSERLAQRLLEESVKVNSIDGFFITPFFRVRLFVSF